MQLALQLCKDAHLSGPLGCCSLLTVNIITFHWAVELFTDTDADVCNTSSSLFCRGFILNEATGRTIKLNSATYNKLVANGHVVDKKNGVLTPPGKGGDDSDDTDQDQQPSYTPSKTAARSRLSSGRTRRS